MDKRYLQYFEISISCYNVVRSFAKIVTKNNFSMSKSGIVKVCSNEKVFEKDVFYF